MGALTKIRHWGLGKYHGGPVRFETRIPVTHVPGTMKIDRQALLVRSVADRVQLSIWSDGAATFDVATARNLANALLTAVEAVEHGRTISEQAP